jgi:hypothetical protein
MTYAAALVVCTLPQTTCALLTSQVPLTLPGVTQPPSSILIFVPEAS